MSHEVSSKPLHRIVFGSCFNPNRGDSIWDLILQFTPNQLILLGDQIYADFSPKTGIWQKSNPEIIRNEYEKFFNLPGWKSLAKMLSHGWISTYDDHDYGVNNGDKTWIYREEAMKYFWEYNKDHFTPVVHPDDDRMDGVYSSQDYTFQFSDSKILKYTVILLDTRSNKDPKGTADGDFLGSRQWKWLEDELHRASLTSQIVFLGSSIQVIPDDKLLEELWNEFPQARMRLLALITKASLRSNVFILSGDIHSAELSQTNCMATLRSRNADASIEIVQIPRRILEFTSSGLSHTFTHRMDVKKVYEVAKKKRNKSSELTLSPSAQPSFVNYLPSLIYSRGFLAEGLFNIYQAAQPSSHRQNRYGDLYPNLHFATLDVYPGVSTKNVVGNEFNLWDSQLAELEWRTVNYEGNTVMWKRVDLYDTTRNLDNGSVVLHWNNSVIRLDDFDVTEVSCLNIQGNVPTWRSLLERMTLTAYVMIVFVIPLCWVLWFIGASIYYLSWGKELQRRKTVEERYHELNKSKIH